MSEDLEKAIAEIELFAKRYEPLDGHFVVEQIKGRVRGRHVCNGQRAYVKQGDHDRVRKSCQAGDILRLLRKIKELAQELERND